jgi:hypothetical protein
MVGWDETHLYLGVKVRDDIYMQGAAGNQIFLGDSVEILLDADLTNDFDDMELSDDDYQLGISFGPSLMGETSEVYLWFPRSNEGTQTDVRVGAMEASQGYQAELAVPWSVFNLTPVEGQRYGFAVSFSDNDNLTENVQQSMVSLVPTRRLADPTSWGTLHLEVSR